MCAGAGENGARSCALDALERRVDSQHVGPVFRALSTEVVVGDAAISEGNKVSAAQHDVKGHRRAKGFKRPTHSNEEIIVLVDTQSAISLAPAGPILQLARPKVVSLLRCFSMCTKLSAASSVS